MVRGKGIVQHTGHAQQLREKRKKDTHDERVGQGAHVQVLQALDRERKVDFGREPRPGDRRGRLRHATPPPAGRARRGAKEGQDEKEEKKKREEK